MSITRTSQPFFVALKPIYDAGWASVDLFFALSGFVFFWLYSTAIEDRSISPFRFGLLRFSRLYPLHWVTLFVVAVLESAYEYHTGHYFIFDSGRWRRFVVSLFLAQQWMPPTEEYVFNGPAWSVSVEVLLYCVFFVFCSLRISRPRYVILAALFSSGLFFSYTSIARGLIGFFMGGAVYHAVEFIKRHASAELIAKRLGWFALAGWALIVIEDYNHTLRASVEAIVGRMPIFVSQIYHHQSENIYLLIFIFSLVPLTIAALASQEQILGRRYKALSFLGDISFSVYLLHFPLQLLCALAAIKFGIAPEEFMKPMFMVGFFMVLIGLGAFSHYWFERPMQRILRDRIFLVQPRHQPI